MGRRIKLDAEQIRNATNGRTITEAAEYLKVGRTTLISRIRELGIGEGRGNYRRIYRRRRKRSVVHDRLVEYSGRVLPSDPRRLAGILGLAPDTVRSYLIRGKKASSKFLHEVLKQAPKNLILQDLLGFPYPIAAIKKMRVITDEWGRMVTIYGTLKSDEIVVFKYRVKDLWDLLEKK